MAETLLERDSVVVNIASSMPTGPPVNSGPCSGRVHLAMEHTCATSAFCVRSSGASALKADGFVADDVVSILVSDDSG